jgi:hypothetical protein
VGKIGLAEAENDEKTAGKESEESKERENKGREENGPGSDLRCACPP